MAPDQTALTHVYGDRMHSKVLYPTLVVAWLVAAGFTTPPPVDGDVGGSVADSATGPPLPGGEVRVLRGGNTVAAATTDAFGRYVIHNVPAGSYSVEVRYLGYRSETRNVAIGNAVARADFRLVPLPINLSAAGGSAAGAPPRGTPAGAPNFPHESEPRCPAHPPPPTPRSPTVGPAPAP